MVEFLITGQHDILVVATYLKNMAVPGTMHVTIEPYKPMRNKKQNDLFHVWCAQLSLEYYLATGKKYTPKAWKEYLKIEFLGFEDIELPDDSVSTTIQSTKRLNKAEFARFLDNIAHFCFAEFGIELVGKTND